MDYIIAWVHRFIHCLVKTSCNVPSIHMYIYNLAKFPDETDNQIIYSYSYMHFTVCPYITTVVDYTVYWYITNAFSFFYCYWMHIATRMQEVVWPIQMSHKKYLIFVENNVYKLHILTFTFLALLLFNAFLVF